MSGRPSGTRSGGPGPWFCASGSVPSEFAVRFDDGAERCFWSHSTRLKLASEPELPEHDPWPLGAKIRHHSYGLGEVVELHGSGPTRTATVRFETRGVKSFRVRHPGHQGRIEVVTPTDVVGGPSQEAPA